MDHLHMFFAGGYGALSQQQQQQQQRRHQRYHLTAEEINQRLQVLCSPTKVSDSQGRRVSEKDVRQIQAFLRLLDDRHNRCEDAQWAWRPRLYAILHKIHAIEFMDDFIRENITDFNLPFNEQTLPQFIGKNEKMNLRSAFFDIQAYYLTDVKDIESEKSLHLTLPVSGDTCFISQGPLGQGSFGGVDLVFSRLSTESYARKRVLRSRGSEQSQKYLIQELRELRRLNHHHLVHIIGSYTDTEYIAYLMKPVASMTLEKFLNTPQPLDSRQKDFLRPFYGCLTGAMNYLHMHRVRHRDLTGRNILIDSSGQVYISDFGSSYNWESKPSSKTKHRNVPTSPDYMAPEVAKEDERGTKSDMWSLGIVFLEMTSKLLDHRLINLRNMIRSNAEKLRVRPYPYANITAVTSWMKTLGTTNTDYEHDKEPLSWIRELLHLEPEHRPTPPQLKKYILESPSFHAFCCIKCTNDFQNEASSYGPTGPRTDVREDSHRTRQEIEEAFSVTDSQSRTQSEAFSQEDTASIEKWIETSFQPQTPTLEQQTVVYPESSVDFDDTQDFDSVRADEFLYNTYEHEFYSQNILNRPGSQSSAIGSPSFDSTETVQLPEDAAWPEDNKCDTQAKSKVESRKQQLEDSELGFLEYASNSTDVDDNDGDDRLQLPFEEWSDRSSQQSEEDWPIQIPNDPLHAMFVESEVGDVTENKPNGPYESSEIQFDEEMDRSDTENPWDEASDRSESGDSSQAHRQDSMDVTHPGTGFMDNRGTSGALMLVEEQLEPVDSRPPTSSMATGCSTPDNKTNKTETRDVSATLFGDDKTPRAKNEVGKAEGGQKIPLPIIPSDDSSGNLTKAGKTTQKGDRKLALSSHTKTGPQRKARIAEKVSYIETKPKSDGPISASDIPSIVIDDVDNTKPQESKLPEIKLQSTNKNLQTRITPRIREALVPIDVRKLMNNTWEMASSNPTTAMSEEGTLRIFWFFLTIPSKQEIEDLLCYYCQKGSSGAVRLVLEKASFKKPLKARRFFRPFMYAVRGASYRHNKCVRALLAAGVDPNQQSRKSGHTPLHVAVQNPAFKGYTNLIWLLLSNNANPNIRDHRDEYPLAKLFLGADTGPLETHKRGALIMLLKEGAITDFTISGTGNTPLHLAVRRQDKISVAMLLHMGAPVDAKTTGGTTALVMTANQFRSELTANHAEVLDHLLQSGANVNERAGVQGRTALHWAAMAGCAQAVTMLLAAGANARLKDKDGYDALGLAVKSAEKMTESGDEGKLADHVEIMLGLEKAARCKLNLKQGKCAVETACKNKDGTMLRQLLTMGLDPNSKYRQTTVLDFAMQQGSAAARKMLKSDPRISKQA
ncbi:hypothetical protein GGS21DRAFT_485898 [Xylaria nigripes]|nr:hypothetical protein GGS21DRAFT_485898 [Xylaria nigripes]